MKSVFVELSEYRQKSIKQLMEEYQLWQGKEFIAQQEDVAKSDNELTVMEFYKNNQPYLYSLACYEISKLQMAKFKIIRKFCAKNNVKKILDYGGGIGGLCIYLRSHGVECDYLDIEGCISDFARWRFQKNNMEARCFFIKGNDLCGPGVNPEYSLVTSSDVLEHIFDVDAALKRISGFLQRGGFFVTSVTFAGGGLHLPKNAVYLDMQKFNESLRSNGFCFLGQLKKGGLSRLMTKLGLGNLVLSVKVKNRVKQGGNLLLYQKV